MKRTLALIVIVFSTLMISCNGEGTKDINYKDVKINTINDSIAFSIGYDIGRRFKQDSIILDYKKLVAGLQAGFAGDSSILSKEDQMKSIQSLQKMLTARQERIKNEEMEKNNKENKKFFEENKNKPGVKVTPSGLQYKIIKEGTGEKPGPESKVKVNYKGMLLDGTVFDSSYDRGQPVTFGVNQVIKGWSEALQMMKKGAKWELYIPPELGYGLRGNPPAIGPNAGLIFEVELLDIVNNK